MEIPPSSSDLWTLTFSTFPAIFWFRLFMEKVLVQRHLSLHFTSLSLLWPTSWHPSFCLSLFMSHLIEFLPGTSHWKVGCLSIYIYSALSHMAAYLSKAISPSILKKKNQWKMQKTWYCGFFCIMIFSAGCLILLPSLQNSDLVLATWSSEKTWHSKPTAPLSCEAPWGGTHCGGIGPCCSIDTSLYTQVETASIKRWKGHLQQKMWNIWNL